MPRKSVVFLVVCLLVLLTAAPALAMLKVLDPDLSSELREIAGEYLAGQEGVAAEAITIEDGWVREFWNVGVDVYMVEAVVNKGLADERKIQLPVRVDRKEVLSGAALLALEEEDRALAPAEPVFRVMAAEGNDAAAEELQQPSGSGSTVLYVSAAALAALLTGAALFIRRRTSKA